MKAMRNLSIPTVEIDGKKYGVENTNDYQKVILHYVGLQLDILEKLRKANARQEQLLKQQGVIEHYMRLLPQYDTLEAVPHLFVKS